MLDMLEKSVNRPDHYSTENLRFRKAYIRERLSDLRTEREKLVAEREKIDAVLGSRQKPTRAEQHP